MIDSTHQYILAEATPSLSLMDDSRHEPGDELWLGNAVLPRGQGMSHDAIDPAVYHAKGPGSDEYSAPALIIDNISDDVRYRLKAFAGGSGIRFYAGVPLVTRLGHSIGVYTVSGDKLKGGVNAEELRIMTDMATIVVNHLETIKNDRARARGERLIRGIGSFIQGAGDEAIPDQPDINPKPIVQSSPDHGPRPPFVRDQHGNSGFKGMTITDQNAAGRDQYPDNQEMQEDGDFASRTAFTRPTTSDVSAQGPQKRPSLTTKKSKPASNSKSQYLAVFDRASRILRKAMNADGVVFLDASSANLSKGSSNRENIKSASSSMSHSQKTKSAAGRGMANAAHALGIEATPDENEHSATSSDNQAPNAEDTGRDEGSHRICEVISTAYKDNTRADAPRITENHLRRLIRRFPQGKVFTFDNQGRPVTSDDSSGSGSASDVAAETIPGTGSRKLPRTSSAVLETIPEARTIVLLPLWDFGKERWNSVAIVWSQSISRLMNIQDDLAYLTAFANSIMNEIARLNLALSDTAKATFLANISHELRSPLHGILGSIEFLHDSPLDDFQSNMVISVETCGKTLLDTVNHVLDFAKLNNLSKATTRQKDGVTQATTSDSSLTSRFDLAVVVEEAVEAVYAGQVFRTANADALEGKGPSLSSSSKAMAKRHDVRDRIAAGQHKHSEPVRLTMNLDNEITMQVVSQPGAVRRIVMNLLGNSLKYTEKGNINISLAVDHSRDHEEDGHLHTCMIVSDTGKGMSDDFVKNHAFTAFSQEDPLKSGTGLGLSIVRQIVDSLGGKIDLKSQKDLGTEVKIWLSFPIDEAKSAPAHNSADKTLLHRMQERTGGLKMCMLSPEVVRNNALPQPESITEMPGVEESMRNLAEQWFSMDVFWAPSMNDQKADFFVYAEPPPIEYLLNEHGEHADEGEVPVILLCQNAFQASSLRANGLHHLVDLGRVSVYAPGLQLMSPPLMIADY